MIALWLLACGTSSNTPSDPLAGGVEVEWDEIRPRNGPDGIPGTWQRLRRTLREDKLSAAQKEEIAQLEALGYADGERAPVTSDVLRVYDAEKVVPGLNLYCSGHASEAFLMKSDGTIVHRWAAKFGDVFPDIPFEVGDRGTNHFRRVLLGENGTLYAIFEGRGILKLDADSKVLWKVENHAHHEAVATEDGIAVLVREGHVYPELDAYKPILNDAIAWMDRDGNERKRVDLLAALLSSPWADMYLDSNRKTGDIFHTNSLQILDAETAAHHPDWKPGMVLVSMRTKHAIGVVDPERETFVWMKQDVFRQQHDAKAHPDGTLSMFDNGPRKRLSWARKYRMPDFELAWTWPDDGPQNIVSKSLGAAQVLPNGGMLITESTAGRAIEIDPEGRIVWDWVSPHRAGENDAFVASLFEMRRLPELTEVPDWAVAPGSTP